ncbi:MAG: YggT family protein [Holosporaceae bacterium]|jgi:uncharacterized protein YggT (Ycf19 family)|nr:YggT family protein [Holosporaceae bacterium]
MDILVFAFLAVVKCAFNFIEFVVIADVLLSWLIFARILDNRNQLLWSLISSVNRLANIVLDPIRKKIPANLVTSVDLSPFFLLLGLVFLTMSLMAY